MIKITKSKFNAYEDVRVSGVTNMFAVKTVMELSGLTREECLNIMKHYTTYQKQYLK